MKNELMSQLKLLKEETDLLATSLRAKKKALREIVVNGPLVDTDEVRHEKIVLKSQLRELEEYRSSLWFKERKLVEKLCIIEAVEQPNEYGDGAELKELHQLIVVDGVQTYDLTTEQFDLFTDYVNIHAMKFR